MAAQTATAAAIKMTISIEKKNPLLQKTDRDDFSLQGGKKNQSRARSCQKATALAAATFRLSTPWDMGILAV